MSAKLLAILTALSIENISHMKKRPGCISQGAFSIVTGNPSHGISHHRDQDYTSK